MLFENHLIELAGRQEAAGDVGFLGGALEDGDVAVQLGRCPANGGAIPCPR